MTAATFEQKQVFITGLRRASEADSGLSRVTVAAAADILNLSERHVRRLVKTGVARPSRQAFRPTDDHVALLFTCHGNLAKTVREIKARGWLPDSPHGGGLCERTIRRGFDEFVDPAIMLAAKEGFAGFRRALSVGVKYAPHKGHTYASDSTPFDVLVRDDKTGEVIDLWQTHVIDEATRFVLAIGATDGSPTTETCIAVLAAAVQGYKHEDGALLGGMPKRVLSDNGGEYRSSAIATGLVRVGFDKVIGAHEVVDGEIIDTNTGELLGTTRHEFTMPGSPYMNGISERFHQTLHQDFCSNKPGYVSPYLDEFERLNLRTQLKANPAGLMLRSHFEALLHAWLQQYNFERIHSSLGTTPFEAWANDPEPVPQPDPEAVRLAMLVDGTRIVDKRRIKAFNSVYVSADLAGFHGREVEIRHLPGRPEFLEVFKDGIHLGTAVRRDHVTDDDSNRIVGARAKQTTTMLARKQTGEQFAAAGVAAELANLGYVVDPNDLPEIPEPSPATKHRNTKKTRTVTDADREAVKQLIAAHITEQDEYL